MSTAAREDRLKKVASLEFEHVGSTPGFFRGTFTSIAEIIKARRLLWLLIVKEIKAKYKDSSLGILWSLARPLTQLLIYYFVIGQVLGAARSIPNFAIYVFVGLTVWGLFAEIVGQSPLSIVSNAGIIKKTYLPREIFPLSTVASAIFNFCVQLIVLIIATFVFGAPPSWQNLPLALLGFIVIIVFSSAIGLFIAAVNVYIRDVQHLVDVLVGILFWTVPVVYSFALIKSIAPAAWITELYVADPITLSILSFQKAFWSTGAEDPAMWPDNLALRLAGALAVSVVLLFLAHRVFARLQRSFAQEL